MVPLRQRGRRIGLVGRLVCLGFAAGIVTVFWLAARVQPDPRGFGTHEQLGLAPCWFRIVSDLPCPTCGATTSFAHFVRGDWSAALGANSASCVAALLSIVAAPWLVISATAGRLVGVERADWTGLGVVSVLALLTMLHWMAQVIPRVM